MTHILRFWNFTKVRMRIAARSMGGGLGSYWSV